METAFPDALVTDWESLAETVQLPDPAGLGAHEGRSAYLDYVVPGLLLLSVASAIQGTSINGRHGHDRRHHRPVPHHGHRACLGPHRPCARQPDTNPGGHGRPHRGRLRTRIPLCCRTAPLAGRDRDTGPVRLRADLARRRARACRQECRDRQQHPDDPFLLLFLSSGFVATATMPTGLRQFAEYQPFTPVADTVRGPLGGTAIGDHAIAAVAWSIGIAVVAYLGPSASTTGAGRPSRRERVRVCWIVPARIADDHVIPGCARARPALARGWSGDR